MNKIRNKTIRFLFLSAWIVVIVTISLSAQNPGDVTKKPDIKFWISIAIGVGGFAFGIYQYLRRRKNNIIQLKDAHEIKKKLEENDRIEEESTVKGQYRKLIREKLGYIDLLGSPDIENKTVRLEDAFVSLSISEHSKCEERLDPHKEIMEPRFERSLSPEEVMTRAFKKYRLLLVVGDPGSGKTTLVKYYAAACLDKTAEKWKQLGFSHEILPLYFPLRELDFNEKNIPVSLPESLAKWSERHLLKISPDRFLSWLREDITLVLLDGLDEIGDKERRGEVCRWVGDMCAGLGHAFFVVTSRATGYRKLDGIELEPQHLRADIMDFSPDQQAAFLKKWFRAVFWAECPPKENYAQERKWKEQQAVIADQRSGKIIEFLNHKDNKAVRELASVPMLLQIMAIIWKDRQHLPETRTELYNAALNYLLDYRDRKRNLKPVLHAEKACRVLADVSLWMQEELRKDEVLKYEMHRFMQPILNKLNERPEAQLFCENLRDRAGLISDYGKDYYIFRHKSFREFLASLKLINEAQNPKRMKMIVPYFIDDWWEETLRFFMSRSDDSIFNRFIELLFHSQVSLRLDDNKQNLLLSLVREAPLKTIDALAKCLDSDKLNSDQRRYVLDCLKTIGTPEAFDTIKKSGKEKWDESNRAYAQDIVAEVSVRSEESIKRPITKDMSLQTSFRNYFEDNVEYIKIPGGAYTYSVTGKIETVPGLYFCKYPVTNKRYNRFISYLEGNEKELEKTLPLNVYLEKLSIFSKSIDGFLAYLGDNRNEWNEKLRSKVEDKKFKGDDQPVVCVTWFGARSYCFWLSCLGAALSGNKKLEDVQKIAGIYRLPNEMEWEWAAGGELNGKIRKYPWPDEKGNPDPKLANYGGNVGATTPVGRYPEGATPHGLMDMAGNVLEWMENSYFEKENRPALRGGSWYFNVINLRCSARSYGDPADWGGSIGFRVVSSQLF